MTGVQVVAVTEDEADLRLDRWFRRHYPGLGHGRLEKLLRTGQIRLDGGRVKASTRVNAGQEIRIPPLDAAALPDAKRRRPPPDPGDVADLRKLILHRDEDVIALNKPPGLAVQGGSRVSRHIDGMLDGLRFGAAERPRLVHRLDKDTSGVLLLGRSASAAARLAASFRGKDAVKTYWALTAGVPDLPAGRVDLAVAKRPTGIGERVVADAVAGKRAITHYVVVAAAGRRVAWLAMWPRTGRTHQLRVHCTSLGTPIIGDRKYGGAASMIEGLPDGGLMLHARAIKLPHPAGGTLEVEAPLHDGMRVAWRFFGFDPKMETPPLDDSP
jgi:23S rRNA pseudouridine955/2504/2580 synthase